MELIKRTSGLAKVFVYFFLLSRIKITSSLDTISPGQSIRDGDTIISTGKSFELGFFSPGNSARRYLGIWYKKISFGTVVWVANREAPLLDESGVLNFTEQGTLVLSSRKGVIWTSNVATTATNPVAQLLDTGNLVVTGAIDGSSNSENYVWQSFNYPTDTHLPGMKLGRNLATGLNSFLWSWKSLDDPAKGDFTFGIDSDIEPDGRRLPQFVLKKGIQVIFRLGPWNGVSFNGDFVEKSNITVLPYKFVMNEKEVYFDIDLRDKSVTSRLVVSPSGLAQRLVWIDRLREWAVYITVGCDGCDTYAICGVNARRTIANSPFCACLEGFEPKSAREWNAYNFSSGCVRTIPLVRHTPFVCDEGEKFLSHEGMKLPDTYNSWYDKNLNLVECQELCSKNCSCTAYANSDQTGGGSGCLRWFGDLLDVRELLDGGQKLYVRVATPYQDDRWAKKKSNKKKQIAIGICFIILAMGIIILGWILYARKRKLGDRGQMKNILRHYHNQRRKENLELPIIDLTTIAKATDNFSSSNKLGKGGFGPVYKGTLLDGKEIAVKRLSVNSQQGVEEFVNEVLLIAKLQHRNLVNLLGCCIEGDEKMLIYEYMPNKSLDYFIFDQSKSRILDWHQRITIIDGIARGLLYLHEDSRLKVIHRDLKASNILLDNDMNPKISDFGMARTFRGNQSEANTNRVMGTYGYMAPEYAVDGLFSTKSDIFSFGVIALEIVSGKKNRGFYSNEHHHNLLGHAWKLWTEERPLELIDGTLPKAHAPIELLRRIHIGLLCVQKRPEDRPNMSTVVLMLCGESSLPQPKQPGFFIERNLPQEESISSSHKSDSTNEMTTSMLCPR